MSILHSVDTIPVEVQKVFADRHSPDKVEFVPAIDLLTLIQSSYDYDPLNFPQILAGMKGYLEFPYLQTEEGDQYSFQTEFLNRVGNITATVGFFHQPVLAEFIYDELRLTIDQMRGKKITPNPLTVQEVDERRIRIIEREEDVYNIYSDDPEEFTVITIHQYHLRLPSSVDLSFALSIERHSEEITSAKDKFLILHELGILDFLSEKWVWQTGGLEGEDLASNHLQFAKLISAVFGFDNPDTVRSYISHLRDRPSFYTEKKAKEIETKISRLGVKKSKKG